MKNPIFWAARCIQEIFIPEIQVFHREILTKVLACLQNDIVEKEATSIEQETWKRLNELVGDDCDLYVFRLFWTFSPNLSLQPDINPGCCFR